MQNHWLGRRLVGRNEGRITSLWSASGHEFWELANDGIQTAFPCYNVCLRRCCCCCCFVSLFSQLRTSIPRDLYTVSRELIHVILPSFLICPPSSDYVLHQSHHHINKFLHMPNMTCQWQADSGLHSGVPTRYTPEAEAAGHSLVDQAGHFSSKMAVILRVFS